MFFYTHVLNSQLAKSYSESGATTYEDAEATESATESGSFFTRSGLISTYTEGEGFFNGVGGGVDKDFAYTSYSYGTRPTSITSASATTGIPDGSGGTSSGTISIFPSGSSTGVDSLTHTTPPTTTAAFSQTFWTLGTGTNTTLLSGTVSGTSTTTGASTLTLSSATCLVPLFVIAMPTVQRWYEARDNPNPTGLRKAGIAFAATHSAGTATVVGLSPGTNSYMADLGFMTDASGTVTGFNTDGIAEGGSTDETYFTGKRASVTAWTASNLLSAHRGVISESACISGTEMGEAFTFSPPVDATWTQGISIANQVFAPRIFTDRKVVDSTTFAWKYQSSSWRLHASSTNTSTTSTYTVAVGLSGNATTDTGNAIQAIGVTTAVLGPLLPFTLSALNVVSVTTRFTDTAGASAYFSSQNSATASSSSSMVTASSSATVSMGSSPAFLPGSYENSLLTWAVANVAVSISTSTWSSLFDGEGSIPSIYRASKWNEASRGDPVSVNQ